MGKYQSYQKAPPKPRDSQVHPIWRGIGCFIGILVPVLAFGLSTVLINYIIDEGLAGTYFPRWMFFTPVLPKFITSSRFLFPIFYPLLKVKHLYGLLIFTTVISIGIFGIISIVYAILYRFVGPPRYSPVDAPPPKVKIKRYKR